MNPAPPVRRMRLSLGILKDNTSTGPRWRPRGGALLGAALLAALALALFRPWVSRPFDILDFSEFLPLLTRHDGAWSRFVAFVAYYGGEHARFNVASYAGLVLKWSLLGASPVAWQWARMLEMGCVVAGVYAVFRRLALRPGPALAGASLFVVTRLSSEAWLRMTMGEPLGLFFALGALLLATGWRDHPRETWRVVGAGALMALAILAKEMLIGLLPVVWVVGVTRQPDGRLGPPAPLAETRRLVALSGLLPLIAFGAVVLVAMTGGTGGFTDLYGRGVSSLPRILGLFTRPWVLEGERGGLTAFGLPGNALFLLLVVAGTWAALRHAERRHHTLMVLGIALGLAVAFTILYFPWPYTYHYYAIPFFLGPALLFGTAIQTLADEDPRAAPAVAGLVVAQLCLVAPEAAQAASVTMAMQQVNGELAHIIETVPHPTRIVVARSSLAPQPWMGTSATLRRYALATGTRTSIPGATTDLLCADAGRLLQHPLGGTIFITYRAVCGGIADPSVHVARGYRVVDIGWSGISVRTDSIAADVLIGLDAMGPRTPPPGAAATPAPVH